MKECLLHYSNTTLVKVKLDNYKTMVIVGGIQIQLLLKLNNNLDAHSLLAVKIQIQLLLKLNDTITAGWQIKF